MVQLLSTIISLTFIVAVIAGRLPDATARLNSREIGLRGTYHNSNSAEPVSASRSVEERRARRKKNRKRKNSKSSRSFSSRPPTAILCTATGRPACPSVMYCHLEGDSCNSSAKGVCEKTSRRCTKIYRPVCGCNSVTYSNACLARWGQGSTGIKAGIKFSGRCERVMS
mmetsp:Transcript_6699/g.10700  ORF Transcript_6699/g.10700 Transcript_6699/m.10700 type:complete len:169 (+) Transcript_6699:52-558(+)